MSRTSAFSARRVVLALFAVFFATAAQAASNGTLSLVPTWNQLSPGSSPSAREEQSMVYDAKTGQVVLFGGYNNTLLGDTWTWSGSTWTQQSPGTPPAARAGAMMAYNPANGTVVLFGGLGNGNTLGDTWTWDGTNWTQQKPANAPSARLAGTMVYDAATGNIVLFGGFKNGGNYLNETWTWDGTNWTKLSPKTSPGGRYYASMAYDPVAGNVVVFGGFGSNAYLNDTWTWDGTTWTQSTSTGPSARFQSAMSYDPAAGQVVLFGGSGNSGLLNDTWIWNGSGWTAQSPVNSPSARGAATLAYDLASQQMLLFGGLSNNFAVNETWNLQVGPVNMGSVNVGATGSNVGTATLTFQANGGPVTFGTNPLSVLTQGAPGMDFSSSASTCTGTLTQGSTCTVTLTFSPKYAGLREGAVQLADSNNNTLASVLLSGIGAGPQVAFNPGSTTTQGGGFSNPFDVAVDGGDNVYVGDFASNVIKVMPSGCASSSCVTTLGGGFSGPEGVAVDGGGNVYVTDYGNNAVKEMPAGCASSSCVTTLGGGFSGPEGVAVDGVGNVYVADFGNNAVKEIPAGCASSSCVITLGGGFTGPQGVAVDGSGNVYVGDNINNAVKEMPAGCMFSSCVTTLGGGFSAPRGVAVDGGGNVYVADSGNSAVKEMPAGCASSSCVMTLGGDYSLATGVALNGAGNVYVADFAHNAVKELNRGVPTLTFPTSTTAGTTDTTDGAQTVTLNNIGNQALSFPPPKNGQNPSLSANFTLTGTSSSSACPVLTLTASAADSLGVGATCSLGVTFTPASGTQGGGVSGQLIFTDNNLYASSAMQKVNLNATVTGGVSQLAFGTAPPTPINAGQNAGSVTVNEEDSNGNTVSGASDTITLTVTYPDATTKTYTAMASGGVATFNLSGVSLTEAGSYTYQASLTGAASVTTSETVVANTTTTVGGTPNPVAVNTAVTFTATVNAAAPGTGTVTGNVVFNAGTQTKTVPLVNGSAQAQFTFTAGANLSVTATYQSSTYFNASAGNTTETVQQYYSYLVTTLTDDATGAAGNCVAGAVDATGGNASCSLRDAIAAANAVGAANTTLGTTITFLASLASGANPQPINLNANYPLGITQPMTITGLGAGELTLAGASATQLMTVSANAVISGLTFSQGKISGSGGAIAVSAGSLTLSNSVFQGNTASFDGGAVYVASGAGPLVVSNVTFAANSASVNGGAIYSDSTATISNATFSGNSASANVGGAVYLGAGGSNAIRNSTFSGNSASAGGGGVATGSSTAITNSIFVNNTSAVGAGINDIPGADNAQNNVYYGNTVTGTGVESDCQNCSTNTNAVSGNPNLAALGNYGGSITTMLPVAPSAAVCAGSLALSSKPNAPSNQAYTDARGAMHTAGYCTASQLDAGAVQTSYKISFTQQPPSIVPASTTISPAPAATVTENNSGIGGIPVAVSANSGTLSGTTPVTTGSTGVATFSDLQLTGVKQGDTLVAAVNVNAGVSGSPISTTSTPFSSLVISPTTLNAGTVGVSFSQALTTANGTAPYTYSISSGALPAGLTLTASGTNAGTISGTPTAGGSNFNFTVMATDSQGATATQSYTMTINPPVLTFGPGSLPTLTVGTSPSITFAAGGGTSPYTYMVTAGSLPAGLLLNPNGTISGTPQHAVSYSFTVTAKDSSTGTGPYSISASYAGTVQQGTATVTLMGLSQVYNNGQTLYVTATTAPPTNLKVNILYGAVGNTPTMTGGESQIGSYSVSGTVSDPDWVGSATGIFQIAKTQATVTLSNLTQTYTGSPIVATATTSNPSGLTVNITYNGSSVAPTAVGSYSVVATVSDPTYAGSANGTLVINKAPLTITGPTVSSTYGAALPSLTGTYSGALGSDSFTVTGSVSPSGTVLNVGNYPITPAVTGPAAGNYTVTAAAGNLTINPATLTIKGPSVSVVYGASQLPSLNGTYTGAVNGDTFTVTGSTTATTQSPVVAGGYAITPSASGANLSNYTVVALPGVLTITPATLTITGPKLSKVYGAAVPASLNGTYSGNVGNDTFTVSGSTTATAASPVVAGGYPITPSVTGANLSNYTVVSVAGVLTVTPATLTITAPTLSIVYGSAVPSLNGTYSGNVGNDTFTVTGSLAVSNPSQLVVGSYQITPAVTGTNLASYVVTVASGSLTVTKATLTITGPSLSKVYGTANPSLNGTYTGSVNGDTFTVSGTTAATVNSPVSASGYAIVPSASGTNLSSYNVTTVNGNLAVTQAALTVTVAAATKTYGSANPVLTGTVTGVVSGDGITASYSTTATASSVVGTYPITASLNDPNAKLANYTVVNTPNVLTVTKTTPTVTLSAPSASVFSGTSITLSATVTASGGSPTGVVTFYDGTTSLGAVLLSSGSASLTVATLPDGPQSISVVYSGDTNYASVTSASSNSTTVVVQDFTISTNIAAQGAPLGGTASYTFTVAPQYGSTIPAAIALSLNGLPIGASYTFSPASIAAGSGATTVTLNVTLPQTLAASAARPAKLGRELAPVALALLMLPFFARKRGRRHMKKLLCLALLVMAGSAATFGMTGCGGSNSAGAGGTTGTQGTAFSLTVTAAAGSLTKSTIVTLNVQQ